MVFRRFDCPIMMPITLKDLLSMGVGPRGCNAAYNGLISMMPTVNVISHTGAAIAGGHIEFVKWMIKRHEIDYKRAYRYAKYDPEMRKLLLKMPLK
jgi:hypothetical protein